MEEVNEIEFGKCEVCGKEAPLARTYWHYPINCNCHAPNHFEMVRHCDSCMPIEPRVTTLTVETKYLSELNNVKQNKVIIKEGAEKDMWGMLQEINVIMWESHMIRDVGLKDTDGNKIMQVLNRWAERY